MAKSIQYTTIPYYIGYYSILTYNILYNVNCSIHETDAFGNFGKFPTRPHSFPGRKRMPLTTDFNVK